MRLVYWVELASPFVGGVETLVAQLTRALAARGYTVTVITNNDGDRLPAEEERDGARIVRLPMREAVLGRDAARLAVTLARAREVVGGTDLIHVHNVGPSSLLLALLGHQVPTLVTLHGEVHRLGDLRDGSIVRRVLAGSAWVTGVSRTVVEGLVAVVPEMAGRSSVIANGVPDEPAPVNAGAQEPATLLCLGRFTPEKGFDVAIRALALVRSRSPEATLVLGGDGVERARLAALAAELGLEGAVRFVGVVARRNVPALLARATVVVVPSHTEGYGLVAAEAACAGRAVVATRTGGLPEVVADGVTGVLVPPDDPAALAGAIGDILRAPERRRQLEEAARARAVGGAFDFDRTVDAYEALYRRLAAGRQHEGSAS